MTDRVHSFTVTHEPPIRADDARLIGEAISMMRGVGVVTPNIVDPSYHAAYMRARRELTTALYEALKEPR